MPVSVLPEASDLLTWPYLDSAGMIAGNCFGRFDIQVRVRDPECYLAKLNKRKVVSGKYKFEYIMDDDSV